MFLHGVVCLMTESRLSGSRWCKQDDFRRKLRLKNRQVSCSRRNSSVNVSKNQRQPIICLERLFSSPSAVATRVSLSAQQIGSNARLGMRILKLDCSLWCRNTASTPVRPQISKDAEKIVWCFLAFDFRDNDGVGRIKCDIHALALSDTISVKGNPASSHCLLRSQWRQSV